MPRISSPRPLDLTKPFVTSSQAYGSQPFDLSQKLVTWYRDIQGDFVPDLSGRGNTARCSGRLDFQPVTASSDTPEFNSNVYGIKSFGLGLGSTSTSISHITTSGSIAGNVSIDHSFTDGTQDFPFSISFWVKPDSVTGAQVIISKYATSGHREWYAFMSNQLLVFDIIGDGGGNIDRVYKTNVFTAGSWHHIVITYDGSYEGTGIKLYSNGSELSSLTYQTFGSGYSISNRMIVTDAPLCIGTNFADLSNSSVSTSEFDGRIHSVAIWKDRQLSSSEISALYNAYVNGPGGEVRSGFISRSPRLQLRELDDLPGAYSTVRRTGDPTRTGALASNFNDETTIIFSESGNAVFPSMLPKGSAFASQAVDIVGQESDISASLPIRSFQHPNHLHYSPTEAVGPFNESRATPTTDFYLSGTDADVIPGFSSPVRSKVAIEIDVTTTSSKKIQKNKSSRTLRNDPSSTLQDQTGFCYFNFSDKSWQDIGLIDPVTKTQIPFDVCITASDDAANWVGNSSLVGQFVPVTVNIKAYDDAQWAAVSAGGLDVYDWRDLGAIDRIGRPSSYAAAPNDTKYHATSSQVLKLSSFISSPMMLEKVVFEFDEVNVVRVQDPIDVRGSSASKLGTYSSIGSNYTFFLYHQEGSKNAGDLNLEVSSSVRHLIASASAFFYSTGAIALDSAYSSISSRVNQTVRHSPNFKYDFNLTNDSNVFAEGAYVGKLRLEAVPSVHGTEYHGSTRVICEEGAEWWDVNQRYVSNKPILSAWPGGTSTRFSKTVAADLQAALIQNTLNPTWSASTYEVGADETYRFDNNKVFSLSSQKAFRKFGGESSNLQVNLAGGWLNPEETQPQSDRAEIAVSPYLLMPGDELIFGVDSSHGIGLSWNAGTPVNTGSWASLTSSYMEITNKPARIILYGSMVKNEKEFFPSLNQDLSSESIHEIIGTEPQLDQFQIDPISSYYGSYLDDVVTGSMATPVLGGILFSTTDQDNSRRVISRVSLGQAGTTGSIQKFVTMRDLSERTYDSCLPDYSTMLSLTPADSQFTYNGDKVPRFTGSSLNQIYETTNLSLSKVKQFPFDGNPARKVQRAAGILKVDQDVASDPIDITGETLSPMDVVYLTRYLINLEGQSGFLPDYTNYVVTYSSKKTYDLYTDLVSSYFLTSSQASDPTLYDVSGRGNHLDLAPDLDGGGAGTNHPRPDESTDVPVSGLFDDGSMEFPGAVAAANIVVIAAPSSYADHKMTNAVSLTDFAFSISVTFKLDNNTTEQTLLERALRDAASPLEREYKLSVDSSGRVDFRIYNATGAGGYKGLRANVGLSTGTWYNVTVTYNGDETETVGSNCCQMYINGQKNTLVTSQNASSPGPIMHASGIGASRLWIGAGGAAGSYEPTTTTEFLGIMHSVHIWKGRVLTAAEVIGLDSAERNGTSIGIIFHRSNTDAFGSPDIAKRPTKPGTYRYGISSVNPEFTSSRWRYDRYGQFRDMLESRRLTARFDGFNPVKIKFVTGSSVIADPTETHTQNLSVFATSSMPYFDDGVARNRSDNPDESLLNLFTITT